MECDIVFPGYVHWHYDVIESNPFHYYKDIGINLKKRLAYVGAICDCVEVNPVAW